MTKFFFVMLKLYDMKVFVRNGSLSSMFVDSIVSSRPVFILYVLYLQPYLEQCIVIRIVSSPTVSFWP